MTTTPPVTVILTVFKRTEYLEEAISSVLRQTFESFELIVTDDANQGKTRAICDKFGTDGRVRYRANPITLGVPLNVAAALRECRTEYVCILNDDDLLYPQMLEHLVMPLQANPQVIAAFGNHEVIDAIGNLLVKETQDLMRIRGRNELKPGIVAHSNDFTVRCGLTVVMGCVFRKSAINPACLVKEVAGAYDYWLAIKLGEQGSLFFVPENVMKWRQHQMSVTGTVSQAMYEPEVYILRSLMSAPLKPCLAKYVNTHLADFLLIRARMFLERDWSTSTARSLLWQSLQTRWRFKVFCHWLSTFVPSTIRERCIYFLRKNRSIMRSPSPK